MKVYARHVGQALKLLDPGHEPPIPWHRVVSSTGAISSRGPGTSGAQRQREALEQEDVEVIVGRTGEMMKVDLRVVGWFPERVEVDLEVET
ncbi:hypothetical protein D9757_009467 [Collybiopsis confluens]|uniref:Methylated-DNA-[protein]-cysteine S-methyltransferase DNA binding domain-containing protein n=1 Tax=Collybiopsis confluens TaxID=2823264 RepID=A0A8H5H3F2_9AGAR|nr:hypothetical protein D9757_008860 [Collybiopsis confluens]KAF5376782.1 hypothetical protein D9757_009467 [Collybiopsis confluens]